MSNDMDTKLFLESCELKNHILNQLMKNPPKALKNLNYELPNFHDMKPPVEYQASNTETVTAAVEAAAEAAISPSKL